MSRQQRRALDRSIASTQTSLEAAERREDWPAVLEWDRTIDHLVGQWMDAR